MPYTRLGDIPAYQSKWLKPADLQGRPHTVVVERAVVEEIRQNDGSKEPMIVVSFRGKAKRLIANKTQAGSLAEIAKTDVFSQWTGLTVVLTPAKARGGQDTIAIYPKSNGATQSPTGDNPFDDDKGPAGAMPGPSGRLIDPKIGGD